MTLDFGSRVSGSRLPLLGLVVSEGLLEQPVWLTRRPFRWSAAMSGKRAASEPPAAVAKAARTRQVRRVPSSGVSLTASALAAHENDVTSRAAASSAALASGDGGETTHHKYGHRKCTCAACKQTSDTRRAKPLVPLVGSVCEAVLI